MRRRKTDYGTIILHWVLAAAFGVALFSGLRIATEMPDQSWLNLLDAVLPDRQRLGIAHAGGPALITVALAYTVYLIRSGLTRRVALDKKPPARSSGPPTGALGHYQRDADLGILRGHAGADRSAAARSILAFWLAIPP